MAKIVGYSTEVVIVDDIQDDPTNVDMLEPWVDTPVLHAKQVREPIKKHKSRLDINDGEYGAMKLKQKHARKRYTQVAKMKRKGPATY